MFGFVKQLFHEDDGKASFSRVFSAIIVVCSLTWITFLVSKDGKMPDLSGLALFVSGSIGTLYGANKMAAAISGKPST